jgi:hypothetical protein
MDKLNNTTSEFEFAETVNEAEEDIPEFADEIGEFEESTAELTEKSEVIIFTNGYRIHGKIALVPGARLTDYIVGAKLFIAVVDVEVKDKADNLILTTPFLNVHRDHIEIILPAEFANMG